MYSGVNSIKLLQYCCNSQVYLLFQRLKTIATVVNYTSKSFIEFTTGHATLSPSHYQISPNVGWQDGGVGGEDVCVPVSDKIMFSSHIGDM